MLLEEVEWIRTSNPLFETYVGIVDKMLAHQGTQLYIGPMLDRMEPAHLVKRAAKVARLGVPNRLAATMFCMNILSWKHQPFIQATCSRESIEQLQQDIEAIAGRPGSETEIEWGLRQIVFERVTPSTIASHQTERDISMYTSRQRVLSTLNHEQADRVPIDLGGNQTGIHKFAYRKLLDCLGLDEEIVIMDLVQQLARPSETVLERLHVDTRYVSAGGSKDFKGEVIRRERDGHMWSDFTDEFGVTWSMPDDYPYYFDISYSPLAGMSLKEIEDYPFPKGDDPSRFEGLRDRALKIKRETPYAVISGISGVVYEICWYMRGLENLFMDMIEQPEVLETIIDQTLKFWLDWFRLFLDEVGDVVDVIMIGDDLGAQNGPLFPPRIYRSIVKPRHKRLVQYIKSRTSAKVWYHTCGSVVEYIPDLLDNGIDILNPVQISAKGMDPKELKDRFGDRLSFWGGGIDTQHMLPHASPDEVREAVRRNVEAFMPGGGYVFNNVHNIQADVPPENILAMFDEACEFGKY